MLSFCYIVFRQHKIVSFKTGTICRALTQFIEPEMDEILSHDKGEASLNYFLKIRMKYMFVYVVVHKYIKVIICLTSVTQLHLPGAMGPPISFLFATTVPVWLFHHSSLTRCSQPFFIFQLLWESVIIFSWVIFPVGISWPLTLQDPKLQFI